MADETRRLGQDVPGPDEVRDWDDLLRRERLRAPCPKGVLPLCYRGRLPLFLNIRFLLYDPSIYCRWVIFLKDLIFLLRGFFIEVFFIVGSKSLEGERDYVIYASI